MAKVKGTEYKPSGIDDGLKGRKVLRPFTFRL